MMKLTKKDKYGMLLEILAEVELADKDMLVEFVQGEVNAIERKAEKAKEITEDESKKGVDDVQKLTDKIIKEIDAVAANKEKEVMEI